MEINWFTLIAQVINFMILVWLMKRFLYKPILQAVSEREKKIKSQLEDAAQKELLAEKEKAAYQKKNETFDAEKGELMGKALAEAEAERNKLIEQARKDADAFQEKLQSDIETSQQDLKKSFEQKVRQGVLDIASKALEDLASESLESQIVRKLIERLHDLNKEELGELKHLITTDQAKVVVQTAFAASESLQAEITQALEDITGLSPEVSFRSAPQLVGGVEIVCEGFKLSWSIKEYIQSLEKEIDSFINRNTLSKHATATSE
jgi:F-type H+-transporting ATPase subunit b